MVSSGAFNYVNVLDKALDASWTRNSVIANNIANVDTSCLLNPGVSTFAILLQIILRM